MIQSIVLLGPDGHRLWCGDYVLQEVGYDTTGAAQLKWKITSKHRKPTARSWKLEKMFEEIPNLEISIFTFHFLKFRGGTTSFCWSIGHQYSIQAVDLKKTHQWVNEKPAINLSQRIRTEPNRESFEKLDLPFLKLTVCPWKWMVGRWFISFPGHFGEFQGRYVSNDLGKLMDAERSVDNDEWKIAWKRCYIYPLLYTPRSLTLRPWKLAGPKRTAVERKHDFSGAMLNF